MKTAPPARATTIVFAAFVVAVAGAFFATQRLKRSSPIVERVFFYQQVSPNGDGRKDAVRLRFDLPKADRVTVTMVDADGELARTLADDRFLSKGTHPFTWDGRNDRGNVVPDGVYRLRVGLRDEGRSVTAPRPLHVDTAPPRPAIVAVTPPTIVPGSAGPRGQVRIRFKGPSNPAPLFAVWRTDGPKPVKVTEFAGRRGRTSATWDTLIDGTPAPPGSYAFSVTVQDTAGNAGSVPTHLPPVRREAVRRGGVNAQPLIFSGPLVPVRPGAAVRFGIGPVGRRVRWRLAPYARGGPIASGEGAGTAFSVRIPKDADADIYSVFIHAGGRTAAWPVVVESGGAAPLLVVLPAMTWQGQNPIESNRDGWPDTLDTGDDVALRRGFVNGRPPLSIARDTLPLLEYLARIRANIQLTTDVALAAKPTDLGRYRGILFAGSERWLTKRVQDDLVKFVEAGGAIASFGTEAFRRRVGLTPEAITDPTPRAREDIFGEPTSPFTEPEPAPLVVSGDQIQLFAETDGFVGLFKRFERSDGLPRGSILQAAAGRPDKRAFVAYKLGKGTVVRVGSPDWAAQLTASTEVAAVTRRIWTLLSP